MARRRHKPIATLERSTPRPRAAPNGQAKREPIATLERSTRRTLPPPPRRKVATLSRARHYRWVALTLSACGLVVCVVLGVRLSQYRQAQREYEQYRAAAEATATPEPTPPPMLPAAVEATPAPTPEPTPEPFFSEMVHDLMKQNMDAVAYLDVWDTAVQYPVVQGEDNTYYLTHTFAKKKNEAGAIFLDCWNSEDFTDFNTVIYGHNMKDGSMFHALREYRREDYLREHRYIEVTLLRSKRVYKVFSAYTAEDGYDFRGFGYSTEVERMLFLEQVRKRSEVATGVTATAKDQLLTLVTCTSGERERHWIVHAVLVDEILVIQE